MLVDPQMWVETLKYAPLCYLMCACKMLLDTKHWVATQKYSPCYLMIKTPMSIFCDVIITILFMFFENTHLYTWQILSSFKSQTMRSSSLWSLI